MDILVDKDICVKPGLVYTGSFSKVLKNEIIRQISHHVTWKKYFPQTSGKTQYSVRKMAAHIVPGLPAEGAKSCSL